MDEREAPFLDGVRVVDKPRFAVVRANPFAIGVLLTLTLLFVTGMAWFLLHVTESRRRAEAVLAHSATAPPTPTTPAPKRDILPRWGISFVRPASVEEIRDAHVPSFPFTPHHSYTVRDTPCRIAYGTVPATASFRDEYPTRAERTRVTHGTTLITHIEGRMSLSPHAHSDTVGTDTETPNTQELFALAYYPLYYRNETGGTTRNAWTLFSVDDSPLSRTCHTAFRDILGTLVLTHPTHTLTRSDSGILSIEHDALSGAHLLFRPDTDHIVRTIATLDTGLIFAPTLVEDTLYYVRTDGTLGTVSLFDETAPRTLPLPLLKDASVHAYLPTEEGIHYLAGVWCMRDTTTCDLTHSIYHDTTGETSEVATGITTPDRTSFVSLVYAHSSDEDTHERPVRYRSLTITNGTIEGGPTSVEGIETRQIPITLLP